MFEVTPDDIGLLTDRQLVDILRRLLLIEARLHHIPAANVHVPLNITVADGGEDGRIEIQGIQQPTDYLMPGLTLFQVKATNMGPADCKKEICKTGGNELKPQVFNALQQGGMYVLFYNKMLVQQGIDNRMEKFKEAINHCLGENIWQQYNLATRFKIYDANKIHSWINNHLSVIIACYEYLGKPIPFAAKTFYEWQKSADTRCDYSKNKFVETHTAVLQDSILAENHRTICRVYGEPGCGKSRFVLQCFSPENLGQDPRRVGLSKTVVYINSNQLQNPMADIEAWLRQAKAGTLIIDNCNAKLHSELFKLTLRDDCRFNIVTIGNEAADETECIQQINFNHRLNIETILKENFQTFTNDQIDLIDEMAFNNVQLALKLAAIIGRLDPVKLSKDAFKRYKTVVDAILFLDGKIDQQTLAVFQAIALFVQVGWDADVSEHYRLVATQICNMDADTFYAIGNRHALLSETILKENHSVFITPAPLKLYLAATWWHECSVDKASNIVSAMLASPYTSSFFKSISMLNVLPFVTDDIEKLFQSQPVMDLFKLDDTNSLIALRHLAEIIPGFVEIVIKRDKASISNLNITQQNLLENVLENLCKHGQHIEMAVNILIEDAHMYYDNGIHSDSFGYYFLKQIFGTGGPAVLIPFERRLQLLRQLTLESDTPPVILFFLLAHIADSISGVCRNPLENVTLGGKKPKRPPGYIGGEISELQADIDYCKKTLLLLIEVHTKNPTALTNRLLKGLFFRSVFTLPDAAVLIFKHIKFSNPNTLKQFFDLARIYINNMKLASPCEKSDSWNAHIEYCLFGLTAIESKNFHFTEQQFLNNGIKNSVRAFLLTYNRDRIKPGKTITIPLSTASKNEMSIFSGRNPELKNFSMPESKDIIDDAFRQQYPYITAIALNPRTEAIGKFECIGQPMFDKKCLLLYFTAYSAQFTIQPPSFRQLLTAKQLCETYLCLGDSKSLPQAKQNAERALALSAQINISETMQTELYQNLAICYQRLAEYHYAQAISSQQLSDIMQVIAHYKVCLTHEKYLSDTMRSQIYSGLGVATWESGQDETGHEALSYFEKALSLYPERANNPNAAANLINMGHVHRANSRFTDAYGAYSEAYTIRCNIYGEDDPRTQKVENLMASVAEATHGYSYQ